MNKFMKLQLSVICAVLFCLLSLPVIFNYRILPVAGTPYWLFTVIIILEILFIYLSFRENPSKKDKQVKFVIFWIITCVIFCGTLMTQIIDRGRNAPGQNYGTHDIILQLESAGRFLRQGNNPYKETYFGTPMEQFVYEELGVKAVNPGLYHFVMPPWYLVSYFPFMIITQRFFGFSDGRIPLMFAMLGLFIVLYKLFKNKDLAYIAISICAFAPGFIDYNLEGRSDGFALFWFVFFVYLLFQKKYLLSGIVYALSLGSKQSIWFSVPVTAIYLWTANISFRQRLIFIAGKVVSAFLIFTPFILWDVQAFFDSAVFYLSGNTANGYPIAGYGLGMLLYSLGIIKNIHAPYPFIIWQILALVLVLFLSKKWFINKLSAGRLLVTFSVLLLSVWYTSRYFNNSHMIFIAVIFSLGAVKYIEEEIQPNHE